MTCVGDRQHQQQQHQQQQQRQQQFPSPAFVPFPQAGIFGSPKLGGKALFIRNNVDFESCV